MKLRLLRTKTFEETSAANLDAAILAWVGATGLTTRQFLSIHYSMAHSVSEAAAYDSADVLFNHTTKETKHCALIAYTD